MKVKVKVKSCVIVRDRACNRACKCVKVKVKVRAKARTKAKVKAKAKAENSRFLKSVTPIRRFSFSAFRVKSTKIETEKIDKIPLENARGEECGHAR